MTIECLVAAYIEDNGWYYDKVDPRSIKEFGGVYFVDEIQGGYKYGETKVTSEDVLLWLHQRILKLEGTK